MAIKNRMFLSTLMSSLRKAVEIALTSDKPCLQKLSWHASRLMPQKLHIVLSFPSGQYLALSSSQLFDFSSSCKYYNSMHKKGSSISWQILRNPQNALQIRIFAAYLNRKKLLVKTNMATCWKSILVARRPIVLTFGTSFTSIGQFGTGPLSSPKPSPWCSTQPHSTVQVHGWSEPKDTKHHWNKKKIN